jgi:rod shape-determining protein MreC
MSRLFDLIVTFKEYVVLLLLTIISLLLISSSDAPEIRSLRAFIVGAVGAVQSSTAWLPNPIALRNENRALHELNIDLAAEVGRLRQAQAENERLLALLGFKQRTNVPLLAAKVVGKTATLGRTVFTLDVGARDSVRADMPVITDEGLVGRIVTVSDHYALLVPLINRDFRASSKISRNRVDGVVAWEAGEYAIMKNVPKAYDVQQNDIAITSEYSNLFPPNVPIGTVVDVGDEPNSSFKKIHIRPAVDFAALEHVFVVLTTSAAERRELEKSYFSGKK